MDTGIQLDTFALFPQETSDESIQVWFINKGTFVDNYAKVNLFQVQLHDIKEIASKVESQASTLIADVVILEFFFNNR